MKRLTSLLIICIWVNLKAQYVDTCYFSAGQKIEVSCNQNRKPVHYYRFCMKQAGMDTVGMDIDHPDTSCVFEPLSRDAEFWVFAINNIGWSLPSEKAIAIYQSAISLVEESEMPFIANASDLSQWKMTRWGNATWQYKMYNGEYVLFMIANDGKIDMTKEVVFGEGLHNGLIRIEGYAGCVFKIYVGDQLVFSENIAGRMIEFKIENFETTGRQTVRLSLSSRAVFISHLQFYTAEQAVPDKPVIKIRIY